MSTADERGALGKRFHDLPTTPDSPDLAWERMARHVLPVENPEEEPRKPRPFIWWWVGGILLAIGVGLWWLAEEEPRTNISTAEVVPMAKSTVPARPTQELAFSSVRPAKVEMKPTASFSARPNADHQMAAQAIKAGSTKPQREGPEAKLEEKVMATPLEDESTVLTTPVSTVEDFYAVEQVNSLPIAFLSLQEKTLTPGIQRPTMPAPEATGRSTIALTLGVASFQSGYEGEAPWLASEQNEWSPEVALRYERKLGKGWFLSAGPELRNYRFRTAFENTDPNARIYQPGTVDTIFRNLTTGEESIVTTDTVPGVRTRRFGHDNTVLELGISLLLGREWRAGRHVFALSAGPRLGFTLSQDGRTVVGTNRVTDLASAPQFNESFRFNARLEAGYAFQLTPTLSVLGRVAGERSISDWSAGTALQQRPTLISGQLGVRVSW
ncbi:MAG: hypothetical protein AAF840_05355 [Bacteroidota bacterium]